MMHPGAERDLLFGVVALRDDLIDPQQFADACRAWVNRKGTPLVDVLVERRAITRRDGERVEQRLQRALKRYGGNARASLAGLMNTEALEALKGVDDPEVQRLIAAWASHVVRHLSLNDNGAPPTDEVGAHAPGAAWSGRPGWRVRTRAAATRPMAMALLVMAVMASAAVLLVNRAQRAEAEQRKIARASEQRAAAAAERAEAARREAAAANEQRVRDAAEAERVAKEVAQKRQTQFETINEILTSIFEDLDPEKAETDGTPLQVRLGAHLDRAAALLKAGAAGEPRTVARLQIALGSALLGLGHSQRAIGLFDEAQRTLAVELGPDDPDTLVAMNNLGEAYESAGQSNKALPLFALTLDRFKARLGPDNPLTLTTMDNLAGAYKATGQLKNALSLYEQTLERRTATLGPDHPDTLTTMNNLGSAYNDAGQWDKAVVLLERALKKREALLAPDRSETLTTMNNLAYAYRAAKQWDKALPLYEQTWEKKKAKLGADHPSTLITMNNVAYAYKDAGQWDKALPLLERGLEKFTAKLGPDHPRTLTALGNLADAYRGAGKFDEAVPVYELTLEKFKARLGPTNPTTLTIMNDLACLLEEMNRFPRAEVLRRERLAGWSRALAVDHPVRVGAQVDLGRCLLLGGKPADAEPLLRESLAIRERTEPDAWTTFSAKSLLGGSLLAQQKYDEAEPLLVQGYEGLKLREGTIPPQGRHVLTEAPDRIVQLYTDWGKPDQAAEWRKKLAETPPDQ